MVRLCVRRPIADAQGRKAINLWGHDKCIVQPLSECPHNCSGRGVCIKVRALALQRISHVSC